MLIGYISTHLFSLKLFQKEHTSAIFLDVEKAFDTIWHDYLLHKMLSINNPIHIIKIIESFLRNLTIMVKVEGKDSSTQIVKAGVPQESCLSLTLFLIYTNDQPVHVKYNITLFVNDIMFFSKDKNVYHARFQLQRLIT